MSTDSGFATTVSREELGALLTSARAELSEGQNSLRSVGSIETGPNELTELAKRYGLEQGRSLSTLHQTAIRFKYSHREEISLRQFASAMLATDRIARVNLGIGDEDVYFLLNRPLVFGWMMLAFGARSGPNSEEIPSRPYTRIEERFIERAAENVSEIFAKAFSDDRTLRAEIRAIEDPVALYNRSKQPFRVISLDAEGFGESGILRIALPLSLMDEAHAETSIRNLPASLDGLAGQIYETPVEIHVELGFGEIALRDLARLSVGDELRLERSSVDGLVINVEESPKFRAEPGKIGKRLAVRITDEIQS